MRLSIHQPAASRLALLLGSWFLLASAGCVTPVRPTPGLPTRPGDATLTEPHAETAPQLQPPAVPPAPAPVATPSRPRLPWVNPARCLSSCAYDPTPELVHVNRQGELDGQGRLRLVAEAQTALLSLMQAARAAGHTLRLESAFRSYDEQAHLFGNLHEKEPGRAARPGHSEHQLGTVADLRLPTKAAIDWLAAHAHDFGFALSYPPGKQKLTGYRPEPWHVRFVGRELAAELYDKNLILEEYFRAQPSQGESGSCADCPLPASQAACGDATREGSCAGNLLTYCYDGALVTLDCASFDAQCGPVEASREHDCLAKPTAPASQDETATQRRR